jgi:hypothetical protein
LIVKHSPFSKAQESRFERILGSHVVAAAGTGAVPVFFSVSHILVESKAMITRYSTVAERPLELTQVVKASGASGSLKIFGKTLLLGGAKTLFSTTTDPYPFHLHILCTMGAAAAGLQTYLLGLTCLAILRSGRDFLTAAEITKLLHSAKETYERFLKKSRSRAVRPKA